MISWSSLKNHFQFISYDNDQITPVSLWDKVSNEKSYPKILLIKELLDNGKAEATESSVLIPHEEICALSTIDQQLLDLPVSYPFDIRLDSDGMLHQRDFIFEWGFYECAEGNKLKGERIGCLINLDDGDQYLLSPEQLSLCNALDEFNSLPFEVKTVGSNFLKFAEIKEFSARSATILDAYLKSQNIIVPQTISLKLKSGINDTIEILPEIEGIDSQQFEKTFDRYPNVREIYNLEDPEGQRSRIVFSKAQRTELEKIKANRHARGEQKRKILEQPQEVFDPDIINLDYFSDRVIEIGFYKPRFYPFISSYKSQWIPGLLVEKSPLDREKVHFENREALECFEQAYRTSLIEGKSTVQWKDISIPVLEAGHFIGIAERQFKDPNKPIKKEGLAQDKSLIIIENVDTLEYTQDRQQSVLPSETFIHHYTSPPNIKKNIQILDHQKEGIAWLQSMFGEYSGALLADDMGLGKTLQILALLDWYDQKNSHGDKPHLIVAPLTLLENWESEFIKFFDTSKINLLKVYGGSLFSGSITNSPDKWENILGMLQKRQIILTTYETLRKHQFLLCAVNWGIVVLDEAQKIKTPGTLITNAAKAIKADFKIAVTGTPVENTLVDLWCIMDFAVPGLLGSAKDFSKEFQNPLKDEETDVKQLGETLRRKIGIHIKRRLKSDVLHELPQKYIKLIQYPMPLEQLQRYEMEINQIQNIQGEGSDRRNAVLKALWAMRDISDHPYLADRQIELFQTDKLIETSAKLKTTVETVESIRERDEKVILFAERKDTQRMLAKVLLERFGIRASIINGDTPVSKQRESSSRMSRQQAIDRFQNEIGFNAIVMSPLVAGVGLNITAANHVIHFSRHWNPAKEDQATDRVYRIGQEKDVYIYLPMSTAHNFKSFDILLHELLEQKRHLASTSLFPTERAEINPEELIQKLFGTKEEDHAPQPLTIEDIDTLDPYLFEAVVASLWQKQGYKTYLTPKSNDRGADVIAFSESQNLILQVKHSKGQLIGDCSIGEVLKSRGYYERKYEVAFSLGIVSNQKLTNNAMELAEGNNVNVFDRNDMLELVNNNSISLSDVRDMENHRFLR